MTEPLQFPEARILAKADVFAFLPRAPQGRRFVEREARLPEALDECVQSSNWLPRVMAELSRSDVSHTMSTTVPTAGATGSSLPGIGSAPERTSRPRVARRTAEYF